MNIDLLTQVTYLPVLYSANIAANLNSAAVLLGGVPGTSGSNTAGGLVTGTAGFKGRLALIVSSGGNGGTTPSVTGYFKSGPDTNIANATNVVLSTYSLTANVSATNPLNSAVTSFTTNGGNQVQTFGFDSRACGNYLFAVTNVTGTNVPFVLTSITLVGTKAYEPS